MFQKHYRHLGACEECGDEQCHQQKAALLMPECVVERIENGTNGKDLIVGFQSNGDAYADSTQNAAPYLSFFAVSNDEQKANKGKCKAQKRAVDKNRVHGQRIE